LLANALLARAIANRDFVVRIAPFRNVQTRAPAMVSAMRPLKEGRPLIALAFLDFLATTALPLHALTAALAMAFVRRKASACAAPASLVVIAP